MAFSGYEASFSFDYAQELAGGPSTFGCLMQFVIARLDSIRLYLDAIVFAANPKLHVENIKSFLSHLQHYSLKFSLDTHHAGAMTVDFLGHTVSSSGLPLDAKLAEVLVKIRMPSDTSLLPSSTTGQSYYRKVVPNSSKRLKIATNLFENASFFEFTPDMERLMRRFLRRLSNPPCLGFFT